MGCISGAIPGDGTRPRRRRAPGEAVALIGRLAMDPGGGRSWFDDRRLDHNRSCVPPEAREETQWSPKDATDSEEPPRTEPWPCRTARPSDRSEGLPSRLAVHVRPVLRPELTLCIPVTHGVASLRAARRRTEPHASQSDGSAAVVPGPAAGHVRVPVGEVAGRVVLVQPVVPLVEPVGLDPVAVA